MSVTITIPIPTYTFEAKVMTRCCSDSARKSPLSERFRITNADWALKACIDGATFNQIVAKLSGRWIGATYHLAESAKWPLKLASGETVILVLEEDDYLTPDTFHQ